MFKSRCNLVFFYAIIALSLCTAVASAGTLTGNPNPPLVSNTVIDVGQISVINSIITGGFAGYSANWIYTAPSTAANIPNGNTAKFTTVNTVPYNDVLIVNAISATLLNLKEGSGNGASNVVMGNLVSTNSVLGTWTLQSNIIDANGLSNANTLLLTLNTLTINPALSVSSVIESNTLLDTGQIEELTVHTQGGSGPFTVNFFNVTSGATQYTAWGYQWFNGNVYPETIYAQSCVTNSNDIYCIGGGNDISVTNVVYYAPILSSNALGSWESTNGYPTEIESQSCVTYSSDIYCIGGYNYSQITNDIYYAPILGSGALGVWMSTNAFPKGIVYQSCSTSSNNIYCIGGVTDDGYIATVYYAPILSSGAVGTWYLSANSYPSDLGDIGIVPYCTASSGNIYCTGGSFAGGTSTLSYYAPILGSGIVGSWINTNSYPSGLFASSCLPISNDIYCIAGTSNAEVLSDITGNVYYAPILSTNALGAWMPSTEYPTRVYDHSCVSSLGNIYCVGGIDLNNEETNATYYAPISTDSNANTFNYTFTANSPISSNIFPYNVIVTDSASTPVTVNSVANSFTVNTAPIVTLTASNTILDNGQYITFTAAQLGGTGLTFNTELYNITGSSPVQSNVILNLGGTNSVTIKVTSPTQGNVFKYEWIATDTGTKSPFVFNSQIQIIKVSKSFASPTLVLSNAVVDSGQIETLVPAITTGSSPFTVNFFNVSSGQSLFTTTYGQWSMAANSYPTNVMGQSCVVSSNVIYCVDGSTGQLGGDDNSVYYSPILNNGNIGAWSIAANAYPTNNLYQSCVIISNEIYCIGGQSAQLSSYSDNSIHYSKILNNGNIGAWSIAANAYPTNIESQSCIASSNNIYCIGGAISTTQLGITSDNVYYAPILGNGNVGAWSQTTTYPTNDNGPSCVIISKDIYCIGGFTIQLGYSNDQNVYYAPILGSGAIGTWIATNAYPTNVDDQSCVASSSAVYCIGGSTTQLSGLDDNSVFYASILSSGALDTWSQTTAYPTNDEYQSCVASSDIVYCIGGNTSQLNYNNDNSVFYASLSNFGVANSPYEFTANSPTSANNFNYNVVVTEGATTPSTLSSATNTIEVNIAPHITLTPSTNPITAGNPETYTLSVSGGTGGFDAELYNITGSGKQGSNVLVVNSGATNTISFIVSNPGSFTFNAVASDQGTTSPYVFNSTQNTIAIMQSSPGIVNSGGGGAASGGGQSPTVENYTANVTTNGITQQSQVGYILRNFSTDNCKTLYIEDKSINLCISYITKTNASIIANNITYTLRQDLPVEIDSFNGLVYYAELLNITYIPIEHAVNLLVFAQPKSNTTNSSVLSTATTSSKTSSSTQISTIIPVTSSVLTTIPQTQATANNNTVELVVSVVVIIIILAVIAAAYYLSRGKKKRGR